MEKDIIRINTSPETSDVDIETLNTSLGCNDSSPPTKLTRSEHKSPSKSCLNE